jgi:serine protease Do
MTMRRYVLTSIALLPLLLTFSHAAPAQNWSVDQPGSGWIFSSDDNNNTSYLGVDIADVTAERVSTLKLKDEKGVEVTMVDQDAPAGKAGIREHDVILSMNGTAVESKAQLQRMIHETPPGRIVTLGLSRDGQPVTVKVQLADKHKEMTSWKPDIHVNVPDVHLPDIDIPSFNMVMITTSARSGLMVENITPQLGEFFGVKNGNGVLVRSVEKGSRAEKAGFRAGDVIVKVNEQPIHDTSDFQHAVKSRNGDSVNIGIMRDRKEQNLSLSLPDRNSGDLFRDESLDGEQKIQAESALEFSQLQDYLAKMKPEMELAAQNSRKAADELRQHADELRQHADELRQQMCKERQELRRQSEKQREQIRKNVENLRRELQQMQEDWI